jgi:hypothetical protein
MTSVVTIKAHPVEGKQVQVTVSDPTMNQEVLEQFYLQNGESAERVVYEDRVVSVREVSKPA